MRLTSTDHTHVTFTDQDDQVYEIDLPAQIGDEEGQVPQHVADALVGLARHDREYQLVADEPQTPKAKKTPKAPKGGDQSGPGGEQDGQPGQNAPQE